ncbi:nucleotidyltransferase domain-containing protein [Candidatus Pacearchaeota archaeon]|nr:nucleotidyltransferase domain-containing protein [Candidatus Pacearchaeota archaeon]
MVRETDLKVVEKFKEKLTKRFQNSKVILFGSRATGNSTEQSDFDLIVVSEAFEDKDIIKRGSLMYDDWDYNFAVDFICYTPEEFKEKESRVSIVSEALKTGVVIK